MRKQTQKKYPFINYEEFVALQQSKRIKAYIFRDGAGAHTSMDENYMLAKRKQHIATTEPLINAFKKAHGPRKGIKLLSRMLDIDPKDEMISARLKDQDFLYQVVAVAADNKHPGCFISLEGFEGTDAHRYVRWDQEKFDRVWKEASKTPKATSSKLQPVL